jgi:transcriptional regulator with XRE-family HTH domain
MNEMAEDARAMVFAEEALVVDVQVLLLNWMEEKGISRAELAKRMGVSRARVTQLLSDECKNLTIRSLARAAHALGETVEVKPTKSRRQSTIPAESPVQSNVVQLWSQAKSFDEVQVCFSNGDERLQGFLTSSQERRIAA